MTVKLQILTINSIKKDHAAKVNIDEKEYQELKE